MTKSPRKNVPDVGIELRAACMPSKLASDRATTPGLFQKLSKNWPFFKSKLESGCLLEHVRLLELQYVGTLVKSWHTLHLVCLAFSTLQWSTEISLILLINIVYRSSKVYMNLLEIKLVAPHFHIPLHLSILLMLSYEQIKRKDTPLLHCYLVCSIWEIENSLSRAGGGVTMMAQPTGRLPRGHFPHLPRYWGGPAMK